MSLSEAIATGDWRLFFLYRDHWRKLQPEDVQRVATAWLKPANRTVGMFLPEANPDRAPEATPVNLAALVENYKGDAAAAAVEAFDPTPANLDARTIRYTMANGMKVALLPKATRGGVVRFSVRLHQGDEQSLLGTPPTGSLMGAMLARGTKTRDRQAFDDAIDRLRAKVAFGGGSTSTSAGGETVRANLAPALKLAVEALRTPSLPASEFEKLTRERATQLEASRTEPTAIAQRALARHDNPYPRGDVRYAATLDEDLAGIARVKIDDVARFHARFVGASHGEVAIVGDFDAAEVRPLLEELFGGWKAAAPYARVPSPYRATTPAELRFETPDKPNAIIIGTINARVRDIDPDYAALAVAERILGGGPEARIPARLREKEGLSYSAGTFMQPGQIDDLGSLGVYAIFPPQALGTGPQGARRGTRARSRRRTHRRRGRLREAGAARGTPYQPRAGRHARRCAREPGVSRTHVRGVSEARRGDRGGRRRRGECGAAQASRPRPHRLGVRRRLREEVAWRGLCRRPDRPLQGVARRSRCETRRGRESGLYTDLREDSGPPSHQADRPRSSVAQPVNGRRHSRRQARCATRCAPPHTSRR